MEAPTPLQVALPGSPARDAATDRRPRRATTPEAPEVRAARRLAAAGWPEADTTVAPMTSGYSGMAAFRVTTPAADCHLKIALDAPLPAAQVAQEIRNARFAAAADIGPALVWADLDAQALMTRLVIDVSAAHRQGGTFNAVVVATLGMLRRLHEAPWPVERCERTLSGADALAKLDRQIASARAVGGRAPLDLTSLRAYGRRLVARLAALPYIESLCHGDMNGSNSLFDGERAWMIDWTYLKLSDGLYELAYYGFHVGCTMADSERLLAHYRAADVAAPRQLERLRAHLALLHVGRYAMRVEGMPWHDPQQRDVDLAQLANRLHEDAQWLGLASPSLAPEAAVLAIRPE